MKNCTRPFSKKFSEQFSGKKQLPGLLLPHQALIRTKRVQKKGGGFFLPRKSILRQKIYEKKNFRAELNTQQKSNQNNPIIVIKNSVFIRTPLFSRETANTMFKV